MMNIDTPDLQEALANDADGSFRAGVAAYLRDWQQRIQQSQQTGLPPDEYEALTQLGEGITTAANLIDLFANIKLSEVGGAKPGASSAS